MYSDVVLGIFGWQLVFQTCYANMEDFWRCFIFWMFQFQLNEIDTVWAFKISYLDSSHIPRFFDATCLTTSCILTRGSTDHQSPGSECHGGRLAIACGWRVPRRPGGTAGWCYAAIVRPTHHSSEGKHKEKAATDAARLEAMLSWSPY